MLRTFILYLALLSTFACKQTDREEVQEQFRERQRAVQERASEVEGDTSNTPPPVQQADTSVTTTVTPAPSTTTGDKVVAIKDGDTIELLRNGQTIKVRLYGVDAPEKNQDFGQRSRQFTSDLAFGKFVKLIEHNKDRYGRTVGTIILPDGRNLNEELVKEGLAWHYKAYSKDTRLANLEADARRLKRGLWASPNPVAPWDFRKDKKETAAQQKAKKKADIQSAPLPAGANTRKVFICSSTGSSVYHYSKDCSVLKRCKEQVLTATEAVAIKQYGRRADKTCSPN
ncbi:thermonuclease family protein [Pontibacter sp. BT310]|uniref:Thermonuclease family protein n=1 Tax=Pontibacter populi TaxID=890055 RepID=A0ABS6XCD7_9BACT|nr:MULTISPECIES: thermonuclease family protein [Pontibacter]MBJ6118814.1 thermonuclease family protein [Pontibacter sp. BT310]MBR0571242.1 thermonuclease family protein [Microvirga sp. STS03]MBW3365668.1 thermonuclease family protein [Pontibacter populi]